MSTENVDVRRNPLLWIGVAITAVLAAVAAGLNWGRPLLGIDLDALLALLVAGMFLLVPVGALIAERRPRNPVGWLLVGAGLLIVVALLTSGYAYRGIGLGLPGAILANWVGGWLVVAMWVLVGFITLLFPDGRPPSRRWAWFASVFGVLGALYVAVAAMGAWPQRREIRADLTHLLPFGGDTVSADLWPAFAALLAVTLFALVVRYRRGEDVERAQIRWLALAGTLTLTASALFAIGRIPAPVVIIVGSVASFAPPIAIAVAILRYRLYEIDRIISRTVAYGLVVAVLAGVYAFGVLGLGTLLSALTGVEGSDLAVAASVLAVVTMFRPLRTRVQHVVDRRFNRTSYHAFQVVDTFPDRIRDEVELEQLRREVAATACVAMQPAHASIWLADEAPIVLAHEKRRP